MENLKTQLVNCKDIEELKTIIDNLEPDKQRSFRSDFARKIEDALWYYFKDFETCIKWCLNVCDAYDFSAKKETKQK